MGKGYYNLVPIDSHIHRMSAMGIRHRKVLDFKNYIDEQEDNGIFVPKTVKKYVKQSLNKEKAFDKAFSMNAEGDVNLDSIDFGALDLGFGDSGVSVPEFTPSAPSIDMPSDSSLASMVSDLPSTSYSFDTGSSGLSVDMPTDQELAQQVFSSPAPESKSIWQKIGDTVNKGVEWEKKQLPKQKEFFKNVQSKAVAGAKEVKKTYDAYKKAKLSEKTSPQPAQKILNKQEYVPQRFVEKDYLKNIDDDELVDYARRESPSMLFKYNRYEDELIRREKNRLRFEKDFAKQSSRTAEQLDSNWSMLGFMNPLATTLSAKHGIKIDMIKGLEMTIKGENK